MSENKTLEVLHVNSREPCMQLCHRVSKGTDEDREVATGLVCFRSQVQREIVLPVVI